MKGWFLELFLQRVPLNKSPFILGRNKSADLTLATGGVSREHAEFLWDEKRECWVLKDLHSTNGTFVNSERLQEFCFLKHADMIYFGNVEVRLCHDSEAVEQNIVDRESLATETINIQPHKNHSIKDKIERAFIHNFQKGLMTTQDLADTLAIDRSTLFRHIKQEYEQSPSDLLRDKRLDYAAQQLLENKSISDAAYSAGFESLSHFSRKFKERFTVSPTDYIKQHKS